MKRSLLTVLVRPAVPIVRGLLVTKRLVSKLPVGLKAIAGVGIAGLTIGGIAEVAAGAAITTVTTLVVTRLSEHVIEKVQTRYGKSVVSTQEESSS